MCPCHICLGLTVSECQKGVDGLRHSFAPLQLFSMVGFESALLMLVTM